MSSLIYFGPLSRVGVRPDGMYSTSLIPAHKKLWKGLIVGIKSGQFSCEVRRVIRDVNLVMFVYGPAYAEKSPFQRWKAMDPLLKEGSVTLSMNGSLVLSIGEMLELAAVAEEARKILVSIEGAEDTEAQKKIIEDLKVRS